MTGKKQILLPHKFQIAGWWLIVGAIVIALAVLIGNVNNLTGLPVILGNIPGYAGLLLVCLSQEKVDDEYISCVRSRIVCIIAAVAIISKIVSVMVTVYGICYHHPDLIGNIHPLSLLYNPVSLAVFYIIALKMTLFIQRQKINRYAEQ